MKISKKQLQKAIKLSLMNPPYHSRKLWEEAITMLSAFLADDRQVVEQFRLKVMAKVLLNETLEISDDSNVSSESNTL